MTDDALMYLIAGGRGSGKTTLARSMIDRRPRTVIFDTVEDYRHSGYPVARTVKGLAHGLRKYWNRDFRIRYEPPGGHEVAALHEVAVLLRKVMRPFYDGRDQRKLTLAVEEMAICFPNRHLKAQHSGFSEMCSLGRHYGIEVIGTTQRLAEVHPRFRGNAEVQFYFRQDDDLDVSAAARRLGKQWRPRLASLENYQFLRRWQGKVTEGRTRP